jgi:hypothetical protein
MRNGHITKVRVYSQDGFEGDEQKFVEIEGKKYQADPADASKPAKDKDGNPVPFEEKKPAADPGKKSVEELAKENPEVAAILAERDDLKGKVKSHETAAAEAERKALEGKGEWQKIADDEKAKRTAAEAKVAELTEHLSKYKDTTKTIYDSLVEQIPTDKRTLIPEEMPLRARLEYVVKNASLLGASPLGNKGGGVPPHKSPTGEKETLTAEFNDLVAKASSGKATFAEQNRLEVVSKRIKELNQAPAK